MSRPTKLTPEIQTRVCDLIRACVPKRTACRCVGINRSTLADWMKRGEDGDPVYADFFAAMDQADAESESTLAQRVQASEDPKLALEALKSRYHRTWNPAIKTEAKVQHSGAVAVNFYIPSNGRDDG